MTHYAWTKIKKEVNEWGRVTKWINPGDEVSQSDLKINDDDWKDLVATGAVREDEYPDVSSQVAPNDYFREHPEQHPKNKDAGQEGKSPTPMLDDRSPKTQETPLKPDQQQQSSSSQQSGGSQQK